MPELTFPASTLAISSYTLANELLITSQEYPAQSCFLVIVHEASSACKLLFIFSINSLGLIFI